MTFIKTIGELLNQPILNADAYKASHHSFEHPEFNGEYAYIEARKGGEFDEIMWFGLQYIIQYYLTQKVTTAMIDEAESELLTMGVPFDRSGWERIVKVHGGHLPIRIKALTEGMVVPQGTVLATIESTDPLIPGIAAYVETSILRVWAPTTLATRSMRWWRLLNQYLELSGTPEESEFKMVDFGARGVTSTETAGILGMAHLVNHQVTDNLMGVRFAKHAYRTNAMPGFTIPATEHSVTTSWGKEIGGAPDRDGEYDFFHRIIDVHGAKKNPLGGRYAVSVVIDTYDQDDAVRMWLDPLHPYNLALTLDGKEDLPTRLYASNMRLVLRPDSGDPIINVVHLLDLVGSIVSFTVNKKGYRVLPDHVRLIQGDGINEDTLRRILQRVTYHMWSIDNLVFGSGGGLLVHDLERDTHRFAMKASEVIVGSETRAIQKKPKTDLSKSSKAGRFVVVRRGGKVLTISTNTLMVLIHEKDLLITRLENGVMHNIQTFEAVRYIAQISRAA